MKKFSFYRQQDQRDCGPTCLRMVAKHYGKRFDIQQLREMSANSLEGSTLTGLSNAAETIGFKSFCATIGLEELMEKAPLPCIVHWNESHYVVVYQIRKDSVLVADPAAGLITWSHTEFKKRWKGITLFLEPSAHFTDDLDVPTKFGLSFFLNYFLLYKKYLWQVLGCMIVGSILQLLFPFLTQSVVDMGINNRDISFVNLILVAQLMLMLSRLFIEFVRSWVLLHVGGRVSIHILSDFLAKLMRLPLPYFESKMTGDILQRVGDHKRIENFISVSTLGTAFSLFNFFLFSIIISSYSIKILSIFLAGSILYFLYILLFMKRRKTLDKQVFKKQAKNQSHLLQIIHGIKEIKTHNSDKLKRWEWESNQADLFQSNLKGLRLSQIQQLGSTIINEAKNIFITITAAKAVIDGEITIGMMLSLQYMIGQMSNPISQLMNLTYAYQDARISMERLSEIHESKSDDQLNVSQVSLPDSGDLVLENIQFTYPGAAESVLTQLSFKIPQGKVTAIVGSSGSGKTTILKLLLKFYRPGSGRILYERKDLNDIAANAWWNCCGAVLQDGYIFSDSIARNIALGDEVIDIPRLAEAIELANLNPFVNSLPQKHHTMIGEEGHGLSQGQRQRLLIARVIYKNPRLILFDEATNALDTNNEKEIVENLDFFFRGKTLVVVAHRLSTVKHADQIIVMDKGEIVEVGTHEELVLAKKRYYHLVKNQLELTA